MTFSDEGLTYAAIHIKKTIGPSYTFEDIARAAYEYLEQSGHAIIDVDKTEVRYRIESNVRPSGDHWHVRRGAYDLESATGLLNDLREAAQAEGRSVRYRLVKVTRTMEVLDV